MANARLPQAALRGQRLEEARQGNREGNVTMRATASGEAGKGVLQKLLDRAPDLLRQQLHPGRAFLCAPVAGGPLHREGVDVRRQFAELPRTRPAGELAERDEHRDAARMQRAA